MTFSLLLLLHAIITFAAGVALIVAPDLIPGAVGIQLQPSQYLVAYLLGAAEFGIAFLSFYARKLTDAHALRLVSATFIVFHSSTALVELFAFLQGASAALWGNITVRVLVVILLWYYGLRKIPPK
jgi:hypothetical protein